jgi:hypothetical protein
VLVRPQTLTLASTENTVTDTIQLKLGAGSWKGSTGAGTEIKLRGVDCKSRLGVCRTWWDDWDRD